MAETTAKKTSWDQRVHELQKGFPNTKDLNWRQAFDKDLDLFGRMIRDILKLDQAPPGRPGPRPALDEGEARKKIRQYMGQDYSELPFTEALAVLQGDRSVRALATKVGLNRPLVQRLKSGQVKPDAYLMTRIAEAFGKQPSYFTEWRIAFITQAIISRLENAPEANIGLYRRLAGPSR